MESFISLSQDSIVISSRVDGEEYDRFQILANGKVVYGDGTKPPAKTTHVTVAVPELDNDEYGNPVIYGDAGNVIPRDCNGYIIEEAEENVVVEELTFDFTE